MRGSIAAVLLLICALVTGCASYAPPKPVASPSYLWRMESKIVGDVEVSAVVLSAEESEQAFATPPTSKGIQPIWLAIENRGDQEYLLMLNSIDPNYFSPSEAAWISRGFGESGGEEKILYFFEQHIPVVILPLERLAYTQGVGVSTDESPRHNYTQDPYFTDGLRAVLFLTEETVGLDRIEWVDWETPPPITTYITGSSRAQ